MAKETLLSKGMWEQYSEKVRDRMNKPGHFGEITKDEAHKANLKLVDVIHGSEACGDAVQLFLLVDKDNVITKARFKSFGCGTAIAASDMMAELCVGKTIDQALRITNLDVERALRDNPETPAVPGQKMHCSVMAYDVIKKAVASYKNVNIKEFDEAEIVCHCGRITRKQIEKAIIEKNLTTVEQVIEATGAGSYCGSCIRPGGHEEKNVYLVNILDDVLRRTGKKEEASVTTGVRDIPFSELKMPQKLKKIEAVLDQIVRPALAADHGGLEVMDLENTTVFISYTGSCAGCAGALHGTLDFIQKTLQEKLNASITVKPFQG